MAAASDKARFYLEQYVPELREYESKGIFSRDEIASITSKRSEFEHTLNARGSSPGDYVRYATYEMNLHALRKKRCRRLGIKSSSFSGQRTVFFVLDRATKKFPGDLALWMQYINFCKKEKANKKLAKVFTSLLRLHPKEYGLWVLAAKHYAETQADMATARNYMQRGLRFCKEDLKLWLEYLKLEMLYLAKIAARRKILGLDEKHEQEVDEDENIITLPSITADDLEPASDDENAKKGVEEVNEDLIKRLENAPAFTGGIPIAIFDSAMKQLGSKASEAAENFFDLISTFNQVPSASRILDHILDWLRQNASSSIETIICEAKRELFSVDSTSAHFPPALSKSLARIKSGSTRLQDKQQPALSEKAVFFLVPLVENTDDMDEDIRKVLETSVKRHLRATSATPRKPGGQKSGPEVIATALQNQGKQQQAGQVLRLAADAGVKR
ncbi:uncharacterized protein MYCFIDRAFT_45820 [Pseudocercospora fijiensis CIRAD86]|uniref:U3 small nucleolar RNA-associated protein 6 N-terminal domain-containing protein n=1 Tax=Pseudocercospora fijiensis (strain CIRAD86) TaxID=383855 RepID=M2ZEX6_PSEFD|nr:uncharacterized protein MYCFIDRAFT_45820 [Pseudocercospora fijiensis CIRAD86]EME77679.1 hypothetical protein MYCFIDRAFT_45820 [Pseudocercospora fijiensis CIRAD86]